MELLTIAWPMTLVNTTNKREHWGARAKRTKAQRAATGLALRCHYVGTRLDPVGRGRMVVTLTRCAPRAFDDDGVVASFKGVRDEIAAYFGVNDNDPRIAWRYSQESAREPTVRVEFRVEPGNGAVAHDVAPGRTKSTRTAQTPPESPKARLGRMARSAVVRNRTDDEGAP